MNRKFRLNLANLLYFAMSIVTLPVLIILYLLLGAIAFILEIIEILENDRQPANRKIVRNYRDRRASISYTRHKSNKSNRKSIP